MLKEGQSAIEFMIVIGAIFFFFLAFLFGIQTSIADKARENKDLTVKEIALTLQNEVNIAVETSDGYYREFRLPIQVVNIDYDIIIVDGLVYIITDDERHSIALSVLEVSGQPIAGDNIIRKEAGVVYLNS